VKKYFISVVGLGYVGLPVAVEMAKKFETVGFDVNEERIKQLVGGVDKTNEVTPSELKESTLEFTSKISDLSKANFHIIAVPTPINKAKQPDLKYLVSASELVGSVLKKGDIVVYESTVYPGATEEDCAPILEKISGLTSGVDFKIGYSPERINPSDKVHTFKTIVKVVSAQDEESLKAVAHVYGSVVDAGVYKAESIKVAEASKVIENSQRDLNVAFMNELSLIFDRMDIDTLAVLKAASTKWNFLNFYPGLVGGHCIGVDPFYLTHKAEQVGYRPHVILAGRSINDGMGIHVAQKAIEFLVVTGKAINKCHVNLMGLTFKEDCPDLRNSKVLDIYKELTRFGINVHIHDAQAEPNEIKEIYGQEISELNKMPQSDVLLFATPHKEYLDLTKDQLDSLVVNSGTVIDVKGKFKEKIVTEKYWRL
jgi:UDP-N-acetyl-D-galactosamine dehydrogenase